MHRWTFGCAPRCCLQLDLEVRWNLVPPDPRLWQWNTRDNVVESVFFFEVRMWGLFLLEHFYFTCMLRWFRRPTAKCTHMLYLMTLLVFLWITWACKRYFQRKDDHFFICSTGSSSLKPNHTTPCFVIKNPQKCTVLKCQEWLKFHGKIIVFAKELELGTQYQGLECQELHYLGESCEPIRGLKRPTPEQ